MIVDLKRRVVELGKIKIGKKSDQERQGASGAWRAPEKLDHFVITGLERDATGNLKPDLQLMGAIATEQKCDVNAIKELPVAFMSDDIEEVFPTQYVAYVGRKCVGRSDGETIEWLADPRNNWAPLPEPKIVENPKNFVQTHTIGTGEKAVRLFKPHGTLNCIIASANARWGGVYKLRTTSLITCEQVVSGLEHVKMLTRGFLRNVPLRLVVRPMQVSPNGKATTVYVVHVELRGADLNAIQQHVIQAAQLEVRTSTELQAARRQYIALLSAPGEDEPEDEQAEIAEEFHPETVDITPAPVLALPAPAATTPAPVAAAAPLPLLDRVAAARTEADFKALQDEVTKSDEQMKGHYYAAREQHLGKPVPPTRRTPTRTPPAPPPRAPAPPAAPAAVVPPPPVVTPPPAAEPAGEVNVDDIPF